MFPWLPTPANLYHTLAIGECGAEWWQILAQFRASRAADFDDLDAARRWLVACGRIEARGDRWFAVAREQQLALF